MTPSLQFSFSEALQPLFAEGIRGVRSETSYEISTRRFKPADSLFFQQMDKYFSGTFRNSYSFRLSGIEEESQRKLVAAVQPVREISHPICVKTPYGKSYGNRVAEANHIDRIEEYAKGLYQHVARELDIRDEPQQSLFVIPSERNPVLDMHQIVLSHADFSAMTDFFLKTEDINLFHFLLGENTVFAERYLDNFPGKMTSKNLVFVRLPSLSYILSACHYAQIRMSERSGLEAQWLQPDFRAFSDMNDDYEDVVVKHKQGKHSILIDRQDYQKTKDEKEMPVLRSGFTVMLRSLIGFIRTNLMPDFIREIYKTALFELEGLPDDVAELPEIKKLRLALAHHENSSRRMTLMHAAVPSQIVDQCIKECLATLDRLPTLRILRRQTDVSVEELTARYFLALESLKRYSGLFRAMEEGKRYEFSQFFRKNLAIAQLQKKD